MSNKPIRPNQLGKSYSAKPKQKKRSYTKDDEVPSFLFDGIPTSLLSSDLSNSLHRSLQSDNTASPYPVIEIPKKSSTQSLKPKIKEKFGSPKLKVDTSVDNGSQLPFYSTPPKVQGGSRGNRERIDLVHEVYSQQIHSSTPNSSANNSVRTATNSDSLRRQQPHSQSRNYGYVTPSKTRQHSSVLIDDSSLLSDMKTSTNSFDTSDYHSANQSLTNHKFSSVSEGSDFSYERTNNSNMEYILQNTDAETDFTTLPGKRISEISNFTENKQSQDNSDIFDVPKHSFGSSIPFQTTNNIVDYYADPHIKNIESSHSHNSSMTSQSSLNKKTVNRSRVVNSPHSRQSSLSWAVNLPDEWTLDRVVYWLNLYGFNKSWIEVFTQNSLVGDKFLALANYNNLSKYIEHLDFTSDSTPSRFIHLLRKTIDKPNSDATARLSSPNFDVYSMRKSAIEVFSQEEKDVQSILSSSDTASVTPSPVQSAGILLETRDTPQNDISYLLDLVPTLSAPNLSSHSKKTHMAKSSQESFQSMQPKQLKKKSSRPFSSIENSSTNFAVPASPASFSHGIFKRHSKSNSSESSIFSTLFNGTSTSYNPDPDILSKKASKLDSPTGEIRKGLINMLRSKVTERGKSIDQQTKSYTNKLVISPFSTVSSPTDTTSLGKRTELNSEEKSIRRQEKALEPSPVDNENRMSLFNFVLDRKYHPKSKKANSDLFILLTKDNKTFQPCNVGSVKNLAEFKLKVLEEFGFGSAGNLAFHLTDFGSDEGEQLDDSVLETLRSFAFYGGTSKLLVYDIKRGRVDSLSNELSLYPSSTSSSIAQSIEIGETNTYPATPQYLLGITQKDPIDYMNFKESYVASRTKSIGKKMAELTTLPTNHDINPHEPATSSKLNNKTDKHSDANSFRLIRKESGDEIDFDKRRDSPFQKSLIVARRNPPPPPSNSTQQGLNRSNSSLIRYTSMKKKLLESQPDSESAGSKVPSLLVTPKNDDEKNYLSPFTPGLSTTLVPQPYRGTLSPISRTPVSPRDANIGDETHLISRIKTSNTSKDEVTKSYSHMRRDDSMKSFRSILEKNKFKENFISFEGAPSLSDDESDTDDSDDDLWAKAPTKTISSENTETTDSDQLLLSAEITPKMTVRPPAEVVYDNLERFFPNTDLDKPIVDDVSSPVMSPLIESASAKSKSPSPFLEKETEKKPKSISRKVSNAEDERLKVSDKGNITGRHQRMKTIRVVAREANEARKRLSQSANNNKKNVLLRRTSTKMWGQKVVEVTPSLIKGGYVSKLKNHKGEYKQFAWVKGQLIGKGTFGKVYLALNVTTGEMMAVKQVKVPRSGKANQQVTEVIDALLSEVETMKDLDHVNIVQYLGFESVGNIYSLFLEYVAGGSVGSCLRMYGRFEEDLIRFLTAQVLQGLAYLHSKGILHRDLKADNLLLEIDGSCKISDFGISKRSQNIYANDAEMSMQGTIFWMAPEVIDNVVHNKKQGYSAKIDIWSLGCVVLEMFAGRRPWSNVEAIGAIYKLGKTKLAPPVPEDTLPYVSQEGKDFIERCFTIDPEKRPTAEELLKHPFCKINPKFDFKVTKLAHLIKFNEKSKEEILRLEAKDARGN